MDPLPIISLWQPWASLLVHGAKRIETRSWRFPLGLPCCLAIHAAKRWTKEQYDFCRTDAFRSALGVVPVWSGGRLPRPRGMAFGAVVGVVRIAACWTAEYARTTLETATGGEVERCFGDYGDGRFAWVTDARMQLAEAVPLAGHQSIWRWEPIAEAVVWVAGQLPVLKQQEIDHA